MCGRKFPFQLVSGTPLDLLFTNREGLVGDVVVGGYIGYRDHEMRELLILGDIIKVVSKISTLNFHRVVICLFRTLVQRVPWERDLNNKEIQEGGSKRNLLLTFKKVSTTYFQKGILKVPEQAVPMC